MRVYLAIILILILIIPCFTYAGEELVDSSKIRVKHLIELGGESLELEEEREISENQDYVRPEIFREHGVNPASVEFLEIKEKGNKLLLIYRLVEELEAPLAVEEERKEGILEEAEKVSLLKNQWSWGLYQAYPVNGLARRSSPGTMGVEAIEINPSGSWAFFHLWDKTKDPMTGRTSTFSYFKLEDGGYAFCLDPELKGPSGQLPIDSFASSKFRLFSEKVATLAIASGGLPGYSFEENFVFAQVYIWQNIPYADGSGARYQVDFRYQHSPFERHRETHEKYLAWKGEIDSLMDKLGKLSFNGERIVLKLGEELRLEDGNKQLQFFNIKNKHPGLEVKKEGNTLILKAKTLGEASLEFWQARSDYPMPEVTFILRSQDEIYQDLAVFRDPFINSIEVRVEENTSGVRVHKKNKEGQSIEGAVFEISSDKDFIKIIEELTTDKKGEALSQEYELNSYSRLYIREKSVPHPYQKSEEVKRVDLKAGQIHSFEFVNDYKPASLRIIKKGPRGEAIDGAVFEISSKESFSEILATVVTQGGRAELGDLDVSVYKELFVREKSVPEPYILNGQVQKFDLEAGKLVEKEFTNEIKKISLKKTDLVTGQAVAGAVIEITDSQGNKKNYTTSSTGEINIEGIASGKYSYREIQSPSGYVLNDRSFNFTIDKDGRVDGIRNFTNAPTRLSIEKVSEDGSALAGAGFAIYLDSGDRKGEKLRANLVSPGYYRAALSGDYEIFYSNQEGMLEIDYLPQGDYLVEEVQAPSGYVRDHEVKSLRVDARGKVDFHLIFVNEPTRIVLKKTDFATGEGIEGAVIILTDSEGRTSEHRTGVDGELELVGLIPGVYGFKEKLAPLGYILNEESFQFELREDGSIDGVRELTNEPTRFRLVKKDRKTGEELEGAIFELYFLKDDVQGEKLDFIYNKKLGCYQATKGGEDMLITNDQGEIVIDYLPLGDYLLLEKSPPKGYVLKNFEQRINKITIDSKSNLKVEAMEIFNDSSEIILKKIDLLSGKALEGVRLEVEGVGIFTSDKRGEFIIRGLEPGSYSFREIEAAPGFVISKERFLLTLMEDGRVSGIKEIKNEPTKLVGKKTDDSKKPLEAVEFKLFDRRGRLIKFDYNEKEATYSYNPKGDMKSVKTDKNGSFSILYLPQGTYTIREIASPQGYKAMEDVVIELADNGLTNPLMINLVNDKELPPTGSRSRTVFLALALGLVLVARKLLILS